MKMVIEIFSFTLQTYHILMVHMKVKWFQNCMSQQLLTTCLCEQEEQWVVRDSKEYECHTDVPKGCVEPMMAVDYHPTSLRIAKGY